MFWELQYNVVPSFGIHTCQRNTYFTRNDTAKVKLVEGRVVFGPAAQGVGLFFGTLKDGSKGGTGEYGM